MNRALILGIAIFFAVVGIALLGGENQAYAGHGCRGCDCSCNGCDCSCSCDCNGCHGCNGCCGRRRMSRRCCGRRHRCHGCNGCHGCHGCGGAAQKGGAEQKGGEVVPAAPEPTAGIYYERTPVVFRRVRFRR